MSAEVITVRPLEYFNPSFVSTEDGLELVELRKAIGTVRQHDNAASKDMEKAIKSIERGPPIAKRGEAFRNFLHLRFFHDLEPTPVARQSLKKVIALDVAVIISARNVGWVQVNKVDAARLQIEYIGALDRMAPAIVKDNAVEFLNLFQQVFFD